jgi:hypothetical protein
MTAAPTGQKKRKTPQPSMVDDFVSDVARDILLGNQDETTGRSQILSCLMGSPAITAMVNLSRTRMPTSGETMADAVRAECEKRLKTKVLSQDNSGVDLLMLTSSSATGWAERFLKSGANWILANAAKSVQEDATDPHSMSTSLRYSDSTYFSGSCAMHREVYAWMEQATRSRKKLNPARSAFALRVIYDLPDVVRPEPPYRQRIVTKLDNNPASAHQAARHQLHIVSGKQVPTDRLDHDMMALWDNYTPEQLYRLVSAGTLAASQIATPGCADFLRPAQRDIKAFTGRVMKAAGKTTKQQRDIIRQALSGFIETEFSLQQLTGAAHKRPLQERAEHQQRYRTHLPAFLRAAASLDTGLGSSSADVYQTLFDLAAPMIQEHRVAEDFYTFTTSEFTPQEVA